MEVLLETCRTRDLSDVMCRVISEYREMPGLRLTAAQAMRLWSLDREQCEAVLRALIESKVLRRARDGTYVLA